MVEEVVFVVEVVEVVKVVVVVELVVVEEKVMVVKVEGVIIKVTRYWKIENWFIFSLNAKQAACPKVISAVQMHIKWFLK